VPTYGYACTSCGHEFETVQAMTDAALTDCPSCGGALRKVFHPVGVTFKGSGFYRTDSRAGSSGTAPAGSSSGSKESAPSSPSDAKASSESSGSSSSDSSSSGPSKPAPTSSPSTGSGTTTPAKSS
jgi:putative FmdB family regulatory protein